MVGGVGLIGAHTSRLAYSHPSHHIVCDDNWSEHGLTKALTRIYIREKLFRALPPLRHMVYVCKIGIGLGLGAPFTGRDWLVKRFRT